MDLTFDNFISYDNDFTVKQERVSDHDEVSINPHILEISESASFYPPFISPQLRNMLDSSDLTIKEPLYIGEPVSLKRNKPFKIIRAKREEADDPIQVKVEPEKKFLANNKREYRRELAKKKVQKKMEAIKYPMSPEQSLMSESFNSSDMDDKTRKKMFQMIRNRISAQNSRDRRRAFVRNLEESKSVLANENFKLADEKTKLLEEVRRLEEANNMLLKERNILKLHQNISCLNCQAPLSENHNCGENIPLSQANKNPLSLGFSMGIVLSLVIMMRLNEQGIVNVNGLVDNELTKPDTLIDKMDGFSSLNWEENYIKILRKCSQSTTISSQGSPLNDEPLTISHQEFEKPYYNIPFDITEGKSLFENFQGSSLFFKKSENDESHHMIEEATLNMEIPLLGRDNQI